MIAKILLTGLVLSTPLLYSTQAAVPFLKSPKTVVAQPFNKEKNYKNYKWAGEDMICVKGGPRQCYSLPPSRLIAGGEGKTLEKIKEKLIKIYKKQGLEERIGAEGDTTLIFYNTPFKIVDDFVSFADSLEYDGKIHVLGFDLPACTATESLPGISRMPSALGELSQGFTSFSGRDIDYAYIDLEVNREANGEYLDKYLVERGILKALIEINGVVVIIEAGTEIARINKRGRTKEDIEDAVVQSIATGEVPPKRNPFFK